MLLSAMGKTVAAFITAYEMLRECYDFSNKK
jgi:hypothetical protein